MCNVFGKHYLSMIYIQESAWIMCVNFYNMNTPMYGRIHKNQNITNTLEAPPYSTLLMTLPSPHV